MLEEKVAARILTAAMNEGRCAELLQCLFDGGSATVDNNTDTLVLISHETLWHTAIKQ